MSVWFEGTSQVNCTLEDVQQSLANPGEHYLEVTRLMPGLTSVELINQSDDSLTIKTNEGLMHRSNLTKCIEAGQVAVDFDEVYEAGSRVTVSSRFHDEFTSSESGVTYQLVISNVQAPGFGGFLYRRFGSSKIGEALLTATKARFENSSRP